MLELAQVDAGATPCEPLTGGVLRASGRERPKRTAAGASMCSSEGGPTTNTRIHTQARLDPTKCTLCHKPVRLDPH